MTDADTRVRDAADDRLDHEPRLGSLPGGAHLVRVSEPAWNWARERAAGGLAPLGTDEHDELRAVGMIDDEAVQSAAEGAPPALVPAWAGCLSLASGAPVTVDLVCVDANQAWTSSLHIAGTFVLLTDQVRELGAGDGEGTLRLGRRSSAISVGVTSVDWLSATVETVIPRHPAFVPGTPAPTASTPLADPPAIAEVQCTVSAVSQNGERVTRGRSWYALGADGEQLATLAGEDDVHLEAAPVGALTEMLRMDLIDALHHAASGAEEGR